MPSYGSSSQKIVKIGSFIIWGIKIKPNGTDYFAFYFPAIKKECFKIAFTAEMTLKLIEGPWVKNVFFFSIAKV